MLVLLAPAFAAALAIAFAARADTGDEAALAQKYSPVVRLVEQPVECGPGEPYIPLDVDLLFGQPTVALRGPWNTTDLVRIGPSAQDLVNRFEYHLDYPGSALSPGCNYERWQRHLLAGRGSPTVYAHVATDPGHPGKLALQYWFFYVFNDFNNTHEGDWEMIQLDFDAADAAEALNTEPTAIGYSSHEGAERADWGDEKLELVDGTHPVVYPAAGSHANKFGAALYLGSSADAGGGLRRHPRAARRAPARREDDSERPGSGRHGVSVDHVRGALGRAATGVLQRADRAEPQDTVDRAHHVVRRLALAKLRSADGRDLRHGRDGLLLYRGRDRFRCHDGPRPGPDDDLDPARDPVSPPRLAGETHDMASRGVASSCAPAHVGRILSSAARMYASRRAGLFVGIGLVFIPLGIVISIVQALVLGGFGLLGVDTSGEGAGALVLLVVTLGTTLALLGFGLVQAATAKALVEIDRGNEVGPVHAYRLALTRFRPLFRTLLIGVGTWVVLTATVFLSPVAL
jgi:hypothetical protein